MVWKEEREGRNDTIILNFKINEITKREERKLFIQFVSTFIDWVF